MRRQGLCCHSASSGGNASAGNVSSQCVIRGPGVIANLWSQRIVGISAKSHTQAAGALYILFDFSTFRFFEIQNKTFLLFNFTTFRLFEIENETLPLFDLSIFRN